LCFLKAIFEVYNIIIYSLLLTMKKITQKMMLETPEKVLNNNKHEMCRWCFNFCKEL